MEYDLDDILLTAFKLPNLVFDEESEIQSHHSLNTF